MVGGTVIRGCVGIAAVMVLASCSDEAAPASAPPPSGEWSKVDPCGLLADGEVAAHLSAAAVKPERDDVPGVGPGCTWLATDSPATLSVSLYEPPFRERDIERAKRKVDVGGKPAYVQADDKDYCLAYLDGGRAWVQLASDSASKDESSLPKTFECDRSFPVLEKVIKKLGW